MGLMLIGYSDFGCQEFIFPEIDNSNYSIYLDNGIFNISQDITLQFDIVDGKWRFLAVLGGIVKSGISKGGYLKGGTVISILSTSGEITLLTLDFSPDLCAFRKYYIGDTGKISIGSGTNNDIICSSNTFVSRQHAVISSNGKMSTITDTSTNGTYVDGRRVHSTVQLEYGSCIEIFGVKIMMLGQEIAISCEYGKIHCNLLGVQPQAQEREAAPPTPHAEQFFRRSPRILPTLYRDKIDIDAPPQPQRSGSRPLLLTIGPSLTMAVPMIVGTLIAAIGSRSNVGSSGIYMFTGVIIAFLSAIIGTTWAILNMRHARLVDAANEELRVQKYKEYIENLDKEINAKYAYNMQSLDFSYPDAASCIKRSDLLHGHSLLWNRNATHEDFLYFRLGVGSLPFQCQIGIPQKKFTMIEDDLASLPSKLLAKYSQLENAPIGINLCNLRLLGIVGRDRQLTSNILRCLIVQAASSICYTDIKMVFLFDGTPSSEAKMWSFARWLPHTWSADHKIRYFAANEAERSAVCFSLANVLRARSEQNANSQKRNFRPYFLVFVSSIDLLEGEPVSKYLLNAETDLGVTTVILADQQEQLPNNCVNIIKNDEDFQGIQNTDLNGTTRQKIVFDHVTAEEANRFAREISALTVKETESGGDIPDSVTFLEMYHVNNIAELNVTERWLKNRTYENMRVPIGEKSGGVLWNLDIHEKYHGPHGLVAGTTGSGKSETLQTYVLSLAVNYSPNDVAFFFIDFKGGGMANLFAKLPHTAGSISNLSGSQVHRAMVSIKSENQRRQRIFGQFGVNHIDQYTHLVQAGEAKEHIPHLFIIIDEFAELKRQEPEFMQELISVAQVGRSLGVHLILATQKPGGTVDDNIWSNTRFKLCLRVQDRQDSNDVLHKPDAAYLLQAGRCYMQVGNDEIYEQFQSGWSGAPYIEDANAENLEIADIWGNIGKSDAVGSGRKLRYLERRRQRWLIAVWHCAKEASQAISISLKDAIKKAGFENEIYDRLGKEGYDYRKSAANSAKLLEFIDICTHLADRAEDDEHLIQMAEQIYRQMNRSLPEIRERTQLAAIVDYLQKSAETFSQGKRFVLWLPLLPSELHLFDIFDCSRFDGERWPERDGTSMLIPIGMYDDPSNQAQQTLYVNLNGHIAICGSIQSGKSTLLQTFLYASVNCFSPDQFNFYVIDYSNRMLAPFAESAHCGGVVFENEPDRTDKLFVMLNKLLDERKKLFQGGSFAQYIKANGFKIPYIVIVIDNYSGFREKTGNAFSDDVFRLTHEGANYGIQFVVTAGGFGGSDIPNSLVDNFQTTLCLQMGDKYKYSEIMHTSHLDVYPEPNIKGRGLANVNGRVLEFQTALAYRASDDYERGEKLRSGFATMAQAWKGSRVKSIPFIPEKPTWNDFLLVINDTVGQNNATGNLPFAWCAKDASVACVDLSKTFCYLISGKARTGKTNLLKVFMLSAAQWEAERYVISIGSSKLKKFAAEIEAKFVSDSAGLFELFSALIPTIRERNAVKRSLCDEELEDLQIYEKMAKFKPIFIFIDDIHEFMKAAYRPDAGVGNISGFLENITEKGGLHNIFFFTTIDYSKNTQSIAYKSFTNMVSYKTGIHLGGNVAAQKLLEFNGMSYLEQTKATKPGIGLLPSDNYGSEPCSVVIPLARS